MFGLWAQDGGVCVGSFGSLRVSMSLLGVTGQEDAVYRPADVAGQPHQG